MSALINNPFPGPQPYRASDRARFYGREDMAYHLTGSILANRCVTVYGPSGAGKSSLVQASVIPSLVDAQGISVVRVDGWPEDKEPTRWLAEAATADLGLGEPPEGLPAEEALLAAARRAARRSPRILLVYLDQIEQILSSRRSEAASEAFFEHLGRRVDAPLRNLRVVLSLREDYLGRFRDRLRDHRRLLDHGFRVGPLTVAELRDAVCQAAAAGEPPQRWDPARVRALMLQVRVQGQAESDLAEAQSAYAQIVCRALFQERAEGQDAMDEGEAEPIVRRYLDATLERLGALRGPAERLLEDHLVTADGSRTLRTEKELARIIPAGELLPILRALEGAAILHATEHQGSRYFEIGHDWLAKKVSEERQQRELAEEQQRELARQRAEADARLARERARRRAFGLIALVSVGVAAGSLGLGLWAWRQKLAAEAAHRVANEQRRIAVERHIEAHDARILAGFRELSNRGQPAWALKLLPEVVHPAERRGWVDLATDALNANALRATLRGHTGSISAAAFSPDGARILSASSDRTARIWSADGAGEPVVLAGHEGPILSAAWSPDGARVVTASEDRTARVWRADGSGQPAVLSGHRGAVTSASFSPDGARVITASEDGAARVYAADGSGEAIVLAGHKGPLTSAVFHPSGASALTASADRTARVWPLDGKGKVVELKGHKAEVLSLRVSPDGARVVTTSRDRTARLWDVKGKGKPIVLAGHEGSVLHAAWSPDGTRVATASADRTARVWSARGNGAPVVLKGHALSVVLVAFSPDGSYLVTASADRTARVWPADGSGASLVLSGHEAAVRSAAWSPDGARVLTAASDRTGRALDPTVKVWSTDPLQSLVPTRRGVGFFHSAFIGAGGERVVSAFDDTTARLFRIGSADRPVFFRGHTAWVTGAALSPSGALVVTTSFDKTARVSRADGAGEAVVLQGHEAPVRAATFSPDSGRIVTVSDDRTARVFRADGAGEAVVLRGHSDGLTSAAWSPDGARIVTTSLDRTARVWAADGTGAPVVLAGHGDDVKAAAFSPDGERVVTASDDRSARIWSARGGGPPIVLRGHEGAVLRAIWSPDGERVATSSSDKTVRLWSARGERSPVVLEPRTPLLAMAFLADGQKILAIGSDNTLHTWMIDVDVLVKRLITAHADCLPPDVRAVYLGEPRRTAVDQFAACERSHGRSSILAEGNAP